MGPPVNDFIATEARFGAQNYEPLGTSEQVDWALERTDATLKQEFL
jgi:hypothetical protein